MTAFTVAAGQTQTARITMAAADTLTVAATGSLSVSANAQAVRFTVSANGADIENSGTIQDTASGGRAIRFENTISSTVNVTINNLTAGSVISGVDDALQIAAASNGSAVVTAGLLTLGNAGLIASTSGQALDFAATGGTFVMNITNSGTIRADVEDAVRIGSASATNSLTNSGTIRGGFAASYSGADGVQFEDNAKGTLTNNNGGAIAGDRHGVNMGVGSLVTVINNLGGTITGNNGSGVGSDGTASVTNFGTITGAFDPNATDINGPGGGGVPDGTPDGDGDGIDIDFQATIENFGLIQGTGASGNGSDGLPNTSEGIAAGGGTITNHTGATIRGLGLGILIDNSSQGNAPFQTTVINDGTIEGTNSIGIKIVSTFADVIVNNGTITGGGGTAILFGAGNNTLRIGTSSVITGLSDGGGGTNTLNYSNFVGSVTVNLGTGAATGTSGVANFQNITGGASDDALTGDGNANVINGGGGADTMAGGGGADLYFVENTGDTVIENANAGYDTVVATANYTLPTNVEALHMVGSGLTGTGTGGADSLLSSGGPNTLVGLGGNDLYYVNNTADTVTEAANGGYDIVLSTVSYTLPDNVEVLYLLGSGLTGTGTGGADSLLSSGGPNTLVGLGGNDLYYVNNTADVVTEAANGGYDIVLSTVSYTLPDNVEVLYLLGSGLTGTGTGGADSLLSSGGPNTLVGLGGNDLYYVNNTADVVTEAANGGYDIVLSTVSYTLPDNVEVLYLLGSGLTVTGTGGADSLLSSGGPNTLVGLGGNDLYYVNNTADVVTEAANGGYDIVLSTVSYALSDNVEVLYLLGSGLTVTGTGGADSLLSSGGPNTLVGLGGNDLYYVNNTADVVTEAANGGYDTVVSTVSYALSDNVEVLYLLGSGLTGTGTGGADSLLSSGGPNTLVGLGGNDLYYVNNTADVVTEAANGGYDTVVSTVSYALSDNVEVLHLVGAGLTGTGTGGNESLLTLGANTLTGGGGDDTFFFVSGTADGAAVSDFDGVGEHDILMFSGFGTAAQGATFTQIGVTDQWQIHSGLDAHNETITLSNHAVPPAGDFFFV